jgi:hypothetical protein
MLAAGGTEGIKVASFWDTTRVILRLKILVLSNPTLGEVDK